MDDSLMDTSILSSSMYLKNIELVIENLEKTCPVKSTSWKQMKETQQMNLNSQFQQPSTISPINLYEIFRSKQSIAHKSLPDLSFLSQYSTELPRSSSIQFARTIPSPTLIIQQQKLDNDRPRTLKSIKRYKNNKHSTEPLQRKHLSEDNLTKSHVNTSSQFSSLSNRYGQMRRCHTDIITLDPIHHHIYSLTDSPPNEFCLQQDDEQQQQQQHAFINLDQPVPLFDVQMNNNTLISPDYLVDKISEIVKHLSDIKQTEKTFVLNNERSTRLDYLLKTDLCSAIQNLLEHGRKEQKKVNIWKIIQLTFEQNSSTKNIPDIYLQAKEFAQNISTNSHEKFQAFIFALLNQNELINWLYFYTRQKDLLQNYYQSPQALILVSIASTFNLFERIMTQLEKLTSFKFHLVYRPLTPADPIMSNSSTTRDWIMTLSRRSSSTSFRSNLTRKFSSFLAKTNSGTRPSLNVDKLKSIRNRPSK